MTNTIISTTGEIKSKAKAPQNRAAKLLGVKISSAVTSVNETYGLLAEFTQIHATECGNEIVVIQDDAKFTAALIHGDLDYEFDAYSAASTYANINRAAGLDLS